jgi:hypothetical protein
MATSQQLHLALTPELAETVRRLGCNALLDAQGEIGGLIILTDSGDPASYEIRLISCDHRSGPFWQLSPEELLQLRGAVRAAQAEGRAVVAYFRTRIHQNLDMETSDGDNIAFACPDVTSTVLVRPSWTGSAQIRMFNRSASGAWKPGQSLSVESPPQTDRGAIAENPLVKVRTVAPVENTRSLIADLSGRRKWFLWIAAAIIGLSICMVLWLRERSAEERVTAVAAKTVAEGSLNDKPSRALPKSSLGLTVTEENGKLHASWDHNSPAALSALFGSLDIKDSSYSKSISLLQSDITGGSIVYSPRSGDVTFRLVLLNRGNEVSEEMVRFVGGESRVAAAPVPQNTALLAPPEVPEVPARNFRVPEQRKKADTATVRFIDAPSVDTPVTAVPVSPLQVPPPVQVRPAIPTPAPPVAKPPVVTEVLTQPVPISRMQPTNTGPNAFRVYAPTTVIVAASIDERGRVTKAVADVDPKTSINPFLVGLCVNAAKEWRFKPATRGGRPVSGLYAIQFQFLPRETR